MRFQVANLGHRIPNSSLIDRPEDYSFEVTPVPEGGYTSVLLDDLNLELNAAGKVISIRGLCPHTRWKESVVTPPQAEFGEITFVPDSPLARSISVPLNKEKYLTTLFDKTSGWVHIVRDGSVALNIKILDGVIFGLTEQGNLCGLWLKPQKLPSF
jgi:hypothetical protein